MGVKVDSIDVDETVKTARKLLEEEQVSPALKAALDDLFLLVTLLCNRLTLNSKNSSKPPSSDPNREKTKREPGEKKPGGQAGHNGSTLERDPNPDLVELIEVDRTSLPEGTYKEVEPVVRQVIDINIIKVVTEYRAQVLEDENGIRHTADFPEGVTKAVQYGVSVKAHATFFSQYQLIPYDRVEETFRDQLGIPISKGSIYNFNKEAFEKLEEFDQIVKLRLFYSHLCHADETGINVNSVRRWLHCTSNALWTYFFPHEKRGKVAMDEIGILPLFKGFLCHDHWKPYFKYNDCLHVLCNAHHLRELERAWEQDGQIWARDMRDLLKEINIAVDDAGGELKPADSEKYREKYRDLLETAQVECPPPDESQRKKGQRGRLKRSKSRSLLERLMDFETETLRFMDDPMVPFTNNQGENDLRMTKVQQKISGCFRSMEGAKIFCRIRSYISTCKKHGMMASEALRILFEGKLPAFCYEVEA